MISVVYQVAVPSLYRRIDQSLVGGAQRRGREQLAKRGEDGGAARLYMSHRLPPRVIWRRVSAIAGRKQTAGLSKRDG
jgi:hypothetical protein